MNISYSTDDSHADSFEDRLNKVRKVLDDREGLFGDGGLAKLRIGHLGADWTAAVGNELCSTGLRTARVTPSTECSHAASFAVVLTSVVQ